MVKKIVGKFIESLEKSEKNEDVKTIISLFDENCEVGNVTLTKNLSGKQAAQKPESLKRLSKAVGN